MIIKKVNTKTDFKIFSSFPKEVYKDIDNHRSTSDDIVTLIIKGHSAFMNHASVISYLAMEDNLVVGRFALINDEKLSDYVQVSFFEVLPDKPEIVDLIVEQARIDFHQCKQIVFGLDGHLNYGAGFLMSKFDESPIFGLPYTPKYYEEYLQRFKKRTMVSYRFPTKPFYDYHKRMSGVDFKGITVRKMNRKKLKEEIEIYTNLNNACFQEHPYWADRTADEDYELFYPFRFLIKEENLLFAEKDGKPIGFFLWYPDFNQLVKNDKPLGLKHVLRYHLSNPINTFRFTEIAVLPNHKVSHAVQAMILFAIPFLVKNGFTHGEGGFIFEENKSSINMTRRFLERATGLKMEPYRNYAVFEGEI